MARPAPTRSRKPASTRPANARDAAAMALAEVAQRLPDVGPTEPATAELSPRDAALADDLYRLGVSRWLTCAHLIDLYAKPALHRLDAPMQGVLIAATAQLLFRPDLPAYAVISEAVESARRVVHPRAAGLANAVMRKVAALIDTHDAQAAWQPSADALPWYAPGVDRPGRVTLHAPVLPDPADHPAHASVATGIPNRLMAAWTEAFGKETAVRLAVHAAGHPPVILQPGNLLWDPREREATLPEHLAAYPEQRVQDPTAAMPITWAAEMIEAPPRVAFDACAGRGTKARQLREAFPEAEVWAYDPDAGHRRDLAAIPGVKVGSPPPGSADLVLFDVPCSNTGVLARRPEARHRFSFAHVNELVALQRRVVAEHLPAAGPGATLVYATCSIQPDENRPQADWLADASGRRVLEDRDTLPGGHGAGYHDGGYVALIVPNR
ncbi:MAG: transcription antitermination factor NusB [Planctomycetota bacterium]